MNEKAQPSTWAHDVPDSNVLAIKPQARRPYDPDVTFEEYHHYAKLTRAEQLALEPPILNVRKLFSGSSRPKSSVKDEAADPGLTAKHYAQENRANITDEDWTNASRAMRTASAGACKSYS
ncbi:hypothetical protein LLEC1_00764 [Akanthomyces lecanii]|uniref:Uncharacterized protein n=1 Tax=Cordyceps confragosa TaxID=2714763 RepID=A0A179IB27_CORDF|nr:hypothetical protein LLEC1_00764 [Akanthomyces lecanii]